MLQGQLMKKNDSVSLLVTKLTTSECQLTDAKRKASEAERAARTVIHSLSRNCEHLVAKQQENDALKHSVSALKGNVSTLENDINRMEKCHSVYKERTKRQRSALKSQIKVLAAPPKKPRGPLKNFEDLKSEKQRRARIKKMNDAYKNAIAEIEAENKISLSVLGEREIKEDGVSIGIPAGETIHTQLSKQERESMNTKMLKLMDKRNIAQGLYHEISMLLRSLSQNAAVPTLSDVLRSKNALDEEIMSRIKIHDLGSKGVYVDLNDLILFYEDLVQERVTMVVGFGDGRTIDQAHNTIGFYVAVKTESTSGRRLLRVLTWGIFPIKEDNLQLKSNAMPMLKGLGQLDDRIEVHFTSDLKFRNKIEGLCGHNRPDPCCNFCLADLAGRQDINLVWDMDEERFSGEPDVKLNGRTGEDLLGGLVPPSRRWVDIMHMLFRMSEQLAATIFARCFRAWARPVGPSRSRKKKNDSALDAVKAIETELHKSNVKRFKFFLKTNVNKSLSGIEHTDWAFGSLREKEWLRLFTNADFTKFFPESHGDMATFWQAKVHILNPNNSNPNYNQPPNLNHKGEEIRRHLQHPRHQRRNKRRRRCSWKSLRALHRFLTEEERPTIRMRTVDNQALFPHFPLPSGPTRQEEWKQGPPTFQM